MLTLENTEIHSLKRMAGFREKVYLCPMGDTLDEESLRTAIRNLLTDAAEEGKRAVLYTVTSKAKDRIEQAFPRTFRFFEIRDSFEYLYLQQKLAKLSGSQFQTRRRQCRLFYRRYSGRVTIEDITPNSISEILDLQKEDLLQLKNIGAGSAD